ncbi:MAG: hypothetical protein FWG69_04130 [Oscillospiraceae bacterium]|nr:hypothetical protein [Oscillospiraceae bacterium]
MNFNMAYGNFTFPVNPKSFTVSANRNINVSNSPFVGTILQDNGMNPRIVTGGGIFHGSTAQSNFNSLWQLFSQGGCRTLLIPSGHEFTAVFTSLKMVGEAGPDLIKYAFEFIEIQPGKYIS